MWVKPIFIEWWKLAEELLGFYIIVFVEFARLDFHLQVTSVISHIGHHRYHEFPVDLAIT